MAAKSILSFTLLSSMIVLAVASCGYESCNPTKPDKLNVHLVPHTHDDVGWLKTVDEYYYGANNDIQHAGVQYILDSVTSELAKNPERRFIYVEIAFFERWWNEQDVATQNLVKQYVNEGRLEFINGGWSMNDEACTHYNAIIDQMTVGLSFLVNTFGECAIPRAAWHIDPFGHSREQASLITQMGFDSFFFVRLDYAEEFMLMNIKRMEQVWHSNPNFGSAADLFLGIIYGYRYGPPLGFCFDQTCHDPPIQDDPSLFDYNVDERVARIVNLAKDQAVFFQTNHVMFTMGNDFQWENANAWYKNLDKLIKYVNAKEEDTGVHLLYSTPSCYAYNLNKANKTWTTTSSDFMPYADSPHGFWTGYYVSRPALKGYVRKSNNLLQVCKQLEAFTGTESLKNSQASTDKLKRAMAVAQHHDAVTGTEKQHVANDYAKRLSIGRVDCQALIGEALSSDISKKSNVQRPDTTEHCEYFNISICPMTETQKSFTVIVYNPVARTVIFPVRVPVNQAAYKVIGPNGTVPTQVQDVTAATKSMRRDRGNATKELIFMATIPPMGYTTYQVSAATSRDWRPQQKLFSSQTKHSTLPDADVTISNGITNLTFDGTTGLLKSMSDLTSNTTVKVTQSFYWYKSSEGNFAGPQGSGAYIFRPNGTEPNPLFDGSTVQLKKVIGDVVQEVQQQFTPWLSQVVRLYYGMPEAEFTWTVGPIPVGDKLGKEIITRFDTDIQSNKTFYTDANGRQILKRILNHRDDFPYINTEPVSGNYYPINSRIFIKDAKSQFTVLTDRSQGGSSLKDGSIEIMIHRRILKDDQRGVKEALNETGQFGDGLIIRGSHFVSLGNPMQAPYTQRTLGEQIYMMPYYYVSTGNHSAVSSSFISSALPPNVHLLTLEQLTRDVVLLRLEHQFEVGEDATYSKNVTVSLQNLFKPFSITSVQELALGANQLLKNVNRLQWKVQGGATPTPQAYNYSPVMSPTFNVTLAPMDIRTFNVTISR